MNNGPTTLTQPSSIVLQSPKTSLQKKPKTSLKTQKQIKNHFTPTLNQACALFAPLMAEILSQIAEALDRRCFYEKYLAIVRSSSFDG